MFDDLTDHLRARRGQVETCLQELLRREGGWPAELRDAVGYSLLAPGKRLRPLLVLLAAEACGGEAEAALPAACAAEMVHTYSLIHDDLPAMDDDDLRRGMPTCHKRFGEAAAILAGDALLTLAFQVLTENYAPSTAAACCRELARGAGGAGMVGGQVEDLAFEQGEWQSVEGGQRLALLERIHAGKTGALFRACLRLGAWVARGECPGGPDPVLLHGLDEYGKCFGQVFQITDDLLDVEGTAKQTGKGVQKDAARGKLTYPGLLGPSESREWAARLSQEARAHLQPLGEAGRWLAALAQYVVARDR